MRDIIAEHGLLGSVIVNQQIGGPVLLTMDPDEFSGIREVTLATVLMDLLRKGAPIDPMIVTSEALARGLDLPGSYLHAVQAMCFDARNASSYAATVRETYRHRRARVAAGDLMQRLDSIDENGEITHLDAVLGDGRSQLANVPEPMDRTTATPPQTLADLLASEATFDWLVPHLLERAERLMITGLEGGGKTYLIRQIATCLAAGIHPFTGKRFGDGLRVLHVDAENSTGQTRRSYREIAAVVARLAGGHGWHDNLMIETQSQGLDLAGDDRSWWDRICASAAPDVIIAGPIYRLHMANPNSEEDVRKLIAALDRPRVRHNAALILEAHAGHTSTKAGERLMRPSGASMWMRWPENGIGLVRSEQDPGDKRMTRAHVLPWRSAREDRAWPDEIWHGSMPMGELPWVPTDELYTGRVQRYEIVPTRKALA
jgi:replicative DNA helicase